MPIVLLLLFVLVVAGVVAVVAGAMTLGTAGSMADDERDPTTVRRMLSVVAPTLDVSEVVFLSEGWDNRVFLINGELIARMAKSEIDSARLLAEVQTLWAIGPKLSLPIPVPEFVHVPDGRVEVADAGEDGPRDSAVPRDVCVAEALLTGGEAVPARIEQRVEGLWWPGRTARFSA